MVMWLIITSEVYSSLDAVFRSSSPIEPCHPDSSGHFNGGSTGCDPTCCDRTVATSYWPSCRVGHHFGRRLCRGWWDLLVSRWKRCGFEPEQDRRRRGRCGAEAPGPG